MPAFDAVLFDLDSTLCVHDQSLDDVHEAVFDRVDVEPFFTPEDMRAVDFDDLPAVESEREFYEAVYRAVADAVGGDPSHAPALAAANVAVVDHAAVSFRDGAEAALAAAREAGPVGLVTNGARDTQTTKLAALGVRDAFDATVFCHPDEGVPGKPDPEPFERALDALGVPPERALMVGDSLGQDVAGAQDAGLAAAWVPDEVSATPDPDPEPEYRLQSPGDLPDVL